ncbi:MAG: M1 family peptidase [Acidobacteriia bacterium]|nr:M1 family peptidase [Terriglobia bacterium]
MAHRLTATIARRAAVASASILIVAVLVFADSYPRQPGVDIRNYIFKLELKDDTNTIAGETGIEVLFKAGGVMELSLDLIGKSADGKTGMTVSGVRSDGQALVFKHENNRLQINLGTAAQAGERRRIIVNYSGIPADGLIIGPNKNKERAFFGDNFPDRCRHWLPTIDHPYDKATCEFAITAPEAYQVVANGDLVETTSLTGNRRLTRYRESVPIATYCMVIGVARFAVEKIGQVTGVPVQSWVYAADRDAGFSDYRIAMKPLEFFSWRIGPFSYEKLANVQSKTRYGGMENSSNIFYSERSVSGQGRNEGLFAHEIAHQWFGDSVTESDWDHTWLSEGFATYLTHVYNEYTYGRDVMVRGLRSDRDRIIAYFQKNPAAAIVTPANPRLNNILSTNSYQKGGWFLHMLRRLVGDEAFWKGISTYYKRYQNGNALTGDFQGVMEEVSGRKLGDFFRQWVYTPGQPALKGTWSYAGGILTVEILQAHAGELVYKTALDIGIVTERNAAPAIQTVQLEQRDQTFTIKLDKEPADVALDPNVWLLMQLVEFAKK